MLYNVWPVVNTHFRLICYTTLCYPERMEEKRCIIERCQQPISAERLTSQPRAVTCSGECSAIHHYNQVKASLSRTRSKKEKAPA